MYRTNSITNTSTLAAVLVLVLAVGLTGCAGGARTANSGDGGPYEKDAVVHTVTAEDRATTRGAQPIAADTALLWINGMGCPQCVTNIDLQLEKQFGAKEIKVDLADGTVRAKFPKKRPSPDELTRATNDAGLTLVRVLSPAK